MRPCALLNLSLFVFWNQSFIFFSPRLEDDSRQSCLYVGTGTVRSSVFVQPLWESKAPQPLVCFRLQTSCGFLFLSARFREILLLRCRDVIFLFSQYFHLIYLAHFLFLIGVKLCLNISGGGCSVWHVQWKKGRWTLICVSFETPLWIARVKEGRGTSVTRWHHDWRHQECRLQFDAIWKWTSYNCCSPSPSSFTRSFTRCRSRRQFTSAWRAWSFAQPVIVNIELPSVSGGGEQSFRCVSWIVNLFNDHRPSSARLFFAILFRSWVELLSRNMD